MATLAEAFQLAVQFHQAGQLREAEQIYSQILAVVPRHAPSLHLLGVIATQLGDHVQAFERISRAIEIDAYQPEMYCNLGSVAEKLGKVSEAIRLYRHALTLNPEYAEAHNNLGLALRSAGQLPAALESVHKAIAIRPNYADALNNCGIVLTDQENFGEAVCALQRAIMHRPNFVEAHNNLGIALMKQGNYSGAIAEYQAAVQYAPHFKLPYNNLANVLLEQGSLEQAIETYYRALKLDPNYADAYCNLGNAYQERGQMDEALEAFRRALILEPKQAFTHYNFGRLLQTLNRHEEAASAFERALELRENYGEAAGMLLNQYISNCDWTRQEAFSQRLLRQRELGKPIELIAPLTFMGLSGPATAEEQLRGAERWVATACKVSKQLQFQHSRVNLERPRLKLGYLSADFHSHATAWLITEMIELHDRERFEVYAYSYGVDDQSPMRQRIVKAFDHFVEIGPESFASSAQRIFDDGIDILIDLKGFTESGRPKILAMRPAPIQVNYLGFPGTMGAEFVDYLIADDFIAPMEHQRFYSEKLAHLPGCYQVNESRPAISNDTPTRSDCQLPDEAFVLCSFNSNYKISREIFDVWMRLMQRVPHSVLWLIVANPRATENLCTAAEARGISRERLVFAPHRQLMDHLPRYRLADLFVDSYPVNAHTTASDALRMGLPLITLTGQTFASRVAGSLLRAVGLDELITYRLEDYEALAMRLVTQMTLLQEIRRKLKENLQRTTLFDGQHFVRNIEDVYRRMWDGYSRGDSPKPIVLSNG